MFEAIRYNLAGLANFSGRDSRSTFWFYMLFLFVVYMILSVVGGLVVAGGMIGGAFEAAKAGADQVEVNRQIMSRFETTIRMSAWLNVVVTLVIVALVAASFTRRLHDLEQAGLDRAGHRSDLPGCLRLYRRHDRRDDCVDAQGAVGRCGHGAGDAGTDGGTWAGRLGRAGAVRDLRPLVLQRRRQSLRSRA
ncbi:DUF805 domain-containing protein [Novosphingobium colocasiae]